MPTVAIASDNSVSEFPCIEKDTKPLRYSMNVGVSVEPEETRDETTGSLLPHRLSSPRSRGSHEQVKHHSNTFSARNNFQTTRHCTETRRHIPDADNTSSVDAVNY